MPHKLEIDQEFLHITVPISEEQKKKLKNSIMKRGCREPIRTWNGIIIDGHKRYAICLKGNKNFSIVEMNFPSRDEAIIWACQERVIDTAPGSAINKFLIGKHYQCAKRITKMERKKNSNSTGNLNKTIEARLPRVAESLGKLYKINYGTVEKYGIFANRMEEIASKNEEFFTALMDETIHVSHHTILEVAGWDVSKIKSFLQQSICAREMKEQSKNLQIQENVQNEELHSVKKDCSEIQLSVGIKNMPAYDPDMELKVLSLTIPTWINSLEKAMSKSNLELVSEKTKNQLSNSLQRLEWQVLLAQEAVEK